MTYWTEMYDDTKTYPKTPRTLSQLVVWASALDLWLTGNVEGGETTSYNVVSKTTGKDVHGEYGCKRLPTTLEEVEVMLEDYADQNDMPVL